MTEVHTKADIDRLVETLSEVIAMTRLRPFHQASWNEPILHEQTSPGERGLLPARRSRPRSRDRGGDALPPSRPELRRSAPPALPELSQPQVLRHYLRLSQETLGNDVNIHLGLGTCTMKYSPKVNEELIRSHKVADLHPDQDDETVQGILEAMWRFERVLCEISGMERFTLQPGGGSQAVYANALMMRAYHAARGESQRDEIVTTIFSHPCDGGGPGDRRLQGRRRSTRASAATRTSTRSRRRSPSGRPGS